MVSALPPTRGCNAAFVCFFCAPGFKKGTALCHFADCRKFLTWLGFVLCCHSYLLGGIGFNDLPIFPAIFDTSLFGLQKYPSNHPLIHDRLSYAGCLRSARFVHSVSARVISSAEDIATNGAVPGIPAVLAHRAGRSERDDLRAVPGVPPASPS